MAASSSATHLSPSAAAEQVRSWKNVQEIARAHAKQGHRQRWMENNVALKYFRYIGETQVGVP